MTKPERKLHVVPDNPKRILTPDKPMPLVPPVFERELIDFRRNGIKWLNSLVRVR